MAAARSKAVLFLIHCLLLLTLIFVSPAKDGRHISRPRCHTFSTFSEHGHVAFQIKGNDECFYMQANILSLHTPSTPQGRGSKVKTFFLKVVMLHIKLMGMEHRAPCKYIF